MSVASLLSRPPFCDIGAGPTATGQAIVDAFGVLANTSAPLASAFALATQASGVRTDDPLVIAGLAAARDIDAGIGDGVGNDYHNSQHYCEVLLCALFIGGMAGLAPRERALVQLAAILHDFHHDGKVNGDPFRLELLAVEKAQPYLTAAGVAADERRCVTALILATETMTGASLARQCHARHIGDAKVTLSMPLRPELCLLIDDPRIALQSVILAEADVLPSVGLTIAHAKRTSARLAREWQIELGPQSKIEFIDGFLARLLVATYFAPNIRQVRQAFAGHDTHGED